MRYITKLISSDLDNEIILMQKRIQEIYGVKLSKVKASRVVAWKSRSYNLPLTEKELLKLIGD